MQKKITKLLKLARHPRKIIPALAHRRYLDFVPDKSYLSLLYWAAFGRRMDWENPKTFNEKLQWLKLHDRNPLYTRLVDKYEVRKYIAEKIGEEYLVPLLGVYDSFDEIDFDKLPKQFVLKTTHDSGGVVICKDKKDFSIAAARRKLEKNLSRNFYYFGREWPYLHVKPRIVCEQYVSDDSGGSLVDYKFFCFSGVPKAMFVATDRGIDTRFDFFDMNFNHLPFMQHYKNAEREIPKPSHFDEMVELSKKLSAGIPHVRVDFYNPGSKVYVGELTFSHFGGFEAFEPYEYDELFGSWIELPPSDLRS